MSKNSTEIPESKIRQVIWMIKAGKTKKQCCEHLGIAYNTKRLDNIVKDFQDKEARVAELKKKAKTKVFSEVEKKSIAQDYQNGEAIARIAERNYVSSPKIKAILIEMGVPIRARKKGVAAKTDHIVQDLDIKFKKDDRVYYGDCNAFAYIMEVMDEDYVDYLKAGIQKYVELAPFNYDNPKFSEPREGIHYEIYWILEKGEMWKLSALKEHLQRVETHIEEYGRESYSVWVDGDYAHRRMFVPRSDLFPVVSK